MMEFCEDCSRLKAAGGHTDVPKHLSRVAALKHEGKVSFNYRCDGCGAEWDWVRAAGWQTRSANTEPRFSRLISAARSRFFTSR